MCVVFAILLALPGVEPAKVPADPGLYYLHGKELTRIEARSVSVLQSSGRAPKIPMKGKLPMTGGGKVSAGILGEHAEVTVTSIPVFYYRVTPSDGHVGAGDLVLVKLKTKRGNREFPVSSSADWKTSSGIPLHSQVEYSSKQVETGVFLLTPSEDLDAGQYGFYLFRGRDLPGLIYDFSVE
jgi:hypothetical protein